MHGFYDILNERIKIKLVNLGTTQTNCEIPPEKEITKTLNINFIQ